jgi:hypothetical protein
MTLNTERLTDADRDMLLTKRDVRPTDESLSVVESLCLDYCTRTTRYRGEAAMWARLGQQAMASFRADVAVWRSKRLPGKPAPVIDGRTVRL